MVTPSITCVSTMGRGGEGGEEETPRGKEKESEGK